MMEYPKYIYLQRTQDDSLDAGETTWCTDKINETDIEYIRKDIFDDLFHELNVTRLEIMRIATRNTK